MSIEQTRQAGQALMGVAALGVLLMLLGVARRSYLAIALPVAAGVALIGALAFWAGYTMAMTEESDQLNIAGNGQPATDDAAEADGTDDSVEDGAASA